MKVLFDHQIFSLQSVGGISKYILNLNEIYIKQGMESKISSIFHINKFLKNSLHKNKKIYLEEYPKFSRKILDFANQVNLLFDINKFKPDILHKTYYHKSDFKNHKTKIALTVYDLIHEIYHKDYGYAINIMPKKKALLSADIIFCISNNTKKDLVKYYNIDDKKIFITYLGVTPPFNIKKEKIINYPYILYVGDRKKYKNFYNFIKAYSISKKLNTNFKLCLVGGGNFSIKEINCLRDLELNMNNIIRMDANDNELENLYQNAKLFVFPSYYEGFGLPNLEAMINGCPVACSNIEIMKEVCGDAATMFDPNQPEDIMFKMEKILFSNEDREKYIRKGKEIASKFTWVQCAKDTTDVYKKFLGN